MWMVTTLLALVLASIPAHAAPTPPRDLTLVDFERLAWSALDEPVAPLREMIEANDPQVSEAEWCPAAVRFSLWAAPDEWWPHGREIVARCGEWYATHDPVAGALMAVDNGQALQALADGEDSAQSLVASAHLLTSSRGGIPAFDHERAEALAAGGLPISRYGAYRLGLVELVAGRYRDALALLPDVAPVEPCVDTQCFVDSEIRTLRAYLEFAIAHMEPSCVDDFVPIETQERHAWAVLSPEDWVRVDEWHQAMLKQLRKQKYKKNKC